MKFSNLYLKTIFFILFVHCNNLYAENKVTKYQIEGEKNFLHEFTSLTKDGYINVVVEIPAGDNDKWEVSKVDGKLKWEYSNSSYRIVKYMPYVSNYGFIPQTIYSKEMGGDGDPLDVILIGERFPRASVIKSKIIGIIKMTDQGQKDDKIIAVPVESKIFNSEYLNSIEDLNKNYPGILEILELWFKNYKLNSYIEIIEYSSYKEAMELIHKTKEPYKTLRGYWLEDR